MAIRTPKILPGEKGYVSKKEKTAKKKSIEKKERATKRKKELALGKIKIGFRSYRIGKPKTTPHEEKKYPIWRYSKKIGEIIIKNKDTTKSTNSKESEARENLRSPDHLQGGFLGKDISQGELKLTFKRFGGIGNFKHLIQDADFQLQWAIREQELLMTQEKCKLCGKNISKSAKPNLYHYKMFKKRTELLEKASKVPEEIVKGKLTIEKGWEKFNDILEEGNRYYMSLRDTALICPACAKNKGLSE